MDLKWIPIKFLLRDDKKNWSNNKRRSACLPKSSRTRELRNTYKIDKPMPMVKCVQVLHLPSWYQVSRLWDTPIKDKKNFRQRIVRDSAESKSKCWFLADTAHESYGCHPLPKTYLNRRMIRKLRKKNRFIKCWSHLWMLPTQKSDMSLFEGIANSLARQISCSSLSSLK